MEDRGDHLAISLTHLNGQERILPLYGSMPYLKRWVQPEHPITESLAPDADPLKDAAPETSIWTLTRSNTRISYRMLKSIPKRVSTRANVPAEVTLHDIRRSRAKLLAGQSGLRAGCLRELFGWVPGMAKEAVETVEDDCNKDIRPRPPVRCPNCGAWTPQKRPCIWCGPSR